MKNLYLYDGEKLRAHITAGERRDGSFVVEYWNPDDCLEEDREVEECSTYSEALARMYQLAFHVTLEYSTIASCEVPLEEYIRQTTER